MSEHPSAAAMRGISEDAIVTVPEGTEVEFVQWKPRVAIVGSRQYPNREDVERFVASLEEGTVVISGGAPGVDTWAEEAAKERGLDVEVIRPLILKKSAPRFMIARAHHDRNKLIAEKCDRLVAFVPSDKATGGTANVIRAAKKLGKPVQVITPPIEQRDTTCAKHSKTKGSHES